MINPLHFRTYVVRPTLELMQMWSEAAEQLLMGTAMQESRLKHLDQLGHGPGPAFGVYQMEPATHDDIWENYIRFKKGLRGLVMNFAAEQPGPLAYQMVGNMFYATAMARLHYRRRPEALPAADDRMGQARYWKDFYNTHQGRGTMQEYLKNLDRLEEAEDKAVM